MDWYKRNPDELYNEFSSSPREGLSSSQADAALAKYGQNELAEEEGVSLLERVLEEFKDPLTLILIVAAILSGVLGDWVESVIIIAIVVINAGLSLYQEGKAEESVKALREMSTPNSKVIRDGREMEISTRDIVPGDIVVLETGDIVPADLRLIESSNLKIDESSLTGESVAVDKDAKVSYTEDMGIGDRQNYAYSSTIVSYGRGKGIVTDTGQNTEIGKIATRIASVDVEETPLQKKINVLSKQIGIIILLVVLVVMVIGVLYGHGMYEMFMMAISLAVAAIPEGLSAIITVVLSLGMQRMAKRNAIVKKLLAVETLGTVTVICSDKTGTLTQNEMTVTKAYVDGKVIYVSGTGYAPEGELTHDGAPIKDEDFPSLYTLLSIGALSNDAKIRKTDRDYEMLGDPTEGALITLAGKKSLTQDELNERYPRVEEIPFDSDRKMMTTFHENFIEGKVVSFTKGAPDIIIDRCNKVLRNGEVVDFTPELKEEAMEANIAFASQALRGLAYAFRQHDQVPEDHSPENIENNMIFVGITGTIDPPRPEAKQAIAETKTAGITTIMITGDYLETAYAIGENLGIVDSKDQAIMGSELDGMSDQELREIVKEKRIFARVSPENKVQLVTALQENGHIVSMTGDGVNDAPALKKADIGVAMGITGTDVAKSTAEVILTDDNFATIVHAVEEGRIIYSNIKKFVQFLLSCNIGEVIIIFIAIVLNIPIPLTPIQLLWLNLVTDSFPALALGVEPGEEDIMDEPPRDPRESIIDRQGAINIGVQAVAISIATLAAYYLGMSIFGVDSNGSRTMAFATLITAELMRAYSARSETHTLAQIGLFTNKTMIYATGFSFALLLAVMYIPPVAELFEIIPLALSQWIIVVGFSVIPVILGEIRKVVQQKNR